MQKFDYIVVGSGLAGLYAAYKGYTPPIRLRSEGALPLLQNRL